METAKIIIIEGDILFLNIMKSFLKNEICCEIIGESLKSKDLLKMKNIHLADVIFVDIDKDMYDRDGFDSVMQIMIESPHSKLIAVTMYKTATLEKLLLDLGFNGFVLKSTFYKDIIPTLNKVLKENVVLNL